MDMNDSSLLDTRPGPTRWRMTVADYYRMAEVGILAEDKAVELIEGEVIRMAPTGSDHSGVINLLNEELVSAAARRATVAVQNPLRLDDESEPEPDLMVLNRRLDSYRGSHPTSKDVVLLIEVSDSSLAYDRGIKVPLYARHGVAEVWIVNLVNRQVEVFRDPTAGVYATIFNATSGQTIEPIKIDGVSIAVSDLF